MSKAQLLRDHKIGNINNLYWNLSTPTLYEEALMRGEGQIAQFGPFIVETLPHTGRSPNDKFIVEQSSNRDKISWGKVNRPISEEHFDRVYNHMLTYIQGRDVFVQDCYAGADPQHRITVRAITEYAWHSLFTQSLLIPAHKLSPDRSPDFTIIDFPGLHANPELHGTNSATFILVNFVRNLVLIGGTRYAGEIKKSAFTYLNYLLPSQGVLPMHCSANLGPAGDVALFFGLSGTGKRRSPLHRGDNLSAMTSTVGVITAFSTLRAAAMQRQLTFPKRRSRRFTPAPISSGRC